MIEDKIPSITDLATTAALTAAENKIPSVSGLVKKKDYNEKNVTHWGEIFYQI